MRISITGHRPKDLGNDYNLTSPLILAIKVELQKIIDTYKPTLMISGMALGIDILWAELAIDNRIPLICAVPCRHQDKMWSKQARIRYNDIINHPNSTYHLVSDSEYNSSVMQVRNIWMTDNCDLLIAVYNNSGSGGTANCVKYAQSINKQLIIINPKEL